MRTYVINLKRRTDRRAYMQFILPPKLEAKYTSDWQDHLDSKEIGPATFIDYGIFQWEISSTNKWWNRPLWKGEIACAISHWMCWVRAHESNDNLFLILEDDIFLAAGIWGKLDQGTRLLSIHDPNWDLLYLGRERLGEDTPFIEGIVRPGYSYNTHAYLLTRHGVEKLLSTSFNKDIIPVDEFLPAMYIDHPREDVRRRYPKCLSAYAFEPPIAFQLSKSLAISDIKDNSEFYEPGLQQ